MNPCGAVGIEREIDWEVTFDSLGMCCAAQRFERPLARDWILKDRPVWLDDNKDLLHSNLTPCVNRVLQNCYKNCSWSSLHVTYALVIVDQNIFMGPIKIWPASSEEDHTTNSPLMNTNIFIPSPPHGCLYYSWFWIYEYSVRRAKSTCQKTYAPRCREYQSSIFLGDRLLPFIPTVSHTHSPSEWRVTR